MDRQEFLARMEVVDAALAKADRPPSAREFEAFKELAGTYSGPVMGAGIRHDQYPPFVGPNLFREICAWYRDRYGDKMKAIGPLATLPVVVRTEVYGIRIPLVLGTWRFTEDRILELIDGLTPSMRSSLTPVERRSICESWSVGFEMVSNIDDAYRLAKPGRSNLSADAGNLITSAREDRDVASKALCQGLKPAAPSGVFHSQQMAEKALKSLLCQTSGISAADVGRRYRHRIAQVFSECVTGHPRLDTLSSDVNRVAAVSMDVRYDAPDIPRPEAVATFNAALRIAGGAALALCGYRPNATVQLSTGQGTVQVHPMGPVFGRNSPRQ